MISKLINKLLKIQNIKEHKKWYALKIFFLKLSNVKFQVLNLYLRLNDIKYNLDFNLNLSLNF
jgi:hypothetical protein